MGLHDWQVDREQAWNRLEELLNRAKYSIYQLPAQEIRETGLLYRALATDLSRARSSGDYQHLVPYLNNLAQRAHAKVYEKPPMQWSDICHFFFIAFPQCFRRHSLAMLASFLAFTLGTLLAMATIQLDPSTASLFLPDPIIESVKSGHLWMEGMKAAPSESTFLMANNIRVALNAYTSGIFFGIGTLVILFHNGIFAFGAPLQICWMYGMGGKLLLFMLPHGVIELTTIMIAGGAGMIIGLALLFPGELGRWDAVQQRAKESMILILGCIPLLVIAGMIEGMVSLNSAVPPPIRIGVACLTAVLLLVYLGFSGRASSSRSQGF